MFSMPRVAVFRSFVLNHAVHHRGQLSVYLRLLDVPIPNIYGPTADTQDKILRLNAKTRRREICFEKETLRLCVFALRLAFFQEAAQTNATLAGRSPSRRMKYGNHSRPNGTYTRMR